MNITIKIEKHEKIAKIKYNNKTINETELLMNRKFQIFLLIYLRNIRKIIGINSKITN